MTEKLSVEANSDVLEPLETDLGTTDSKNEQKRQVWSNKVEYILASIGNAVGLGNIWRFSYQCQKHGGGAFLIPYFSMLFLVGYPLLFMEIAIGQKMRNGAIGAWIGVSSYVSGIGFASLVVCIVLALYYNVILSWALVYAVNSFRMPLPWTSCPVLEGTNSSSSEHHENYSELVPECELSSPTVYFWYRETLDVSATIESGGQINWWIVVSLFFAWTIIFFALLKGIKSTGKVMYFTVTFPYVVLTAFAIRALLLEGSTEGIIYLFNANLSKLCELEAWTDAATQIFFSLGMGYGVYIAYASYNPVRNNCAFDTLIVATANSLTSLFSSVIVFAVLGFKATLNMKKCIIRNEGIFNGTISENTLLEMNMTRNQFKSSLSIGNLTEEQFDFLGVEKCSTEKELNEAVGGTGLAFIAFTEAIVNFPGSNFWSVIFFMMLVSIGASSLVGSMNGIIAAFRDIGLRVSKFRSSLFLCTGAYIGGLMFTTKSGSYLLELFDSNVASICLLFVVLCEVLSVSFVYGMNRFVSDIQSMTGRRPHLYWIICIKWISPALLTASFIVVVIDFFGKPPTYEAWDRSTATKSDLVYPWWGNALIAILILSSVLCVPICALLHRLKIVNFKKMGNSSGQ